MRVFLGIADGPLFTSRYTQQSVPLIDGCYLIFLQVFKHYFEELEEESLRDNFVVVVSVFVFDEFTLKLVFQWQ